MNFGLIADGNRRWARENDLPLKMGHKQGFLTIRNEIFPVLEADPDFTALTVYGFSTENWKRAPLEVKNLMDLFCEIFDGWVEELIEKKVRFIHAGRKDKIPQKLLQKLQIAEERSKQFTKFTIYLCLDYGGRDEIIRALKNPLIKGDIGGLTEKTLTESLKIPDLDIVLRSGGEQRISNFCIWQAAYAEFFFLNPPLPAIKKEDIQIILNQFKSRDRRVGS